MPAVAVRRMGQALLVFTGCKGYADGLNYYCKRFGYNFLVLQFCMITTSLFRVAGILNEGVKSVEIKRNTKSEGMLLI